MVNLPLTKLAETASTVTLGWTPIPCLGYVLYADGVRKSNSWDPLKASWKTNKATEIKVVALGAAAEGVYPPVVVPPAPASGAKFFIFVGAQDSSAKPLIAAAEGFFGKPVHGASTFVDTSSWAGMASTPSWACSWQNTVRPGFGWSWGLRMIPNGGPTLSQLVTNYSTYKTYFTQAAQNLSPYNNANCHIRLAWEANGSWNIDSPRNPRNGGNDFANFKTAWRLIVDTMKAVNPDFKFQLCFVQGRASADADLMLPDDPAYVDSLGLDVYDQTWGVTNPSVWANREQHLEYNIGCNVNWFRNLVTDPASRFHGKPAWLPEVAGWGKTGRNTNGADQYGNEPLFVDWISRKIAEGWVTGISLFNDNTTGANETVNGVATGRLHAVITAGTGGGQSSLSPAVPTSDVVSGGKWVSENHSSAAARWKAFRDSLG
jgi:hypothetical protein